mmetsp:Transcript_14409/g.32929  ORF Transcript_14409/g.32929 Transcript_14409/m.32929 type:complete len:419 (+) Transcript_14409:174-1430(+)
MTLKQLQLVLLRELLPSGVDRLGQTIQVSFRCSCDVRTGIIPLLSKYFFGVLPIAIVDLGGVKLIQRPITALAGHAAVRMHELWVLRALGSVGPAATALVFVDALLNRRLHLAQHGVEGATARRHLMLLAADALVEATEGGVEVCEVLHGQGVALVHPLDRHLWVVKEERRALFELQLLVTHLVKVGLAQVEVCAVVHDHRRPAEVRLITRVEHHVAADPMGHAHLCRGEDVAVHLRVPSRLHMAHGKLVGIRLLCAEGLVEKGLGVGVSEGAHALRVLKPQRRNGAQVLAVEDVKPAHLGKALVERCVDETARKAGARPNEVCVLGRDDVAEGGAECDRVDRSTEEHVGVHHQDELLADVVGLQPRAHRVRLVVRGVARPLLVVERIADLAVVRVVEAHVAVHKRRPDVHVFFWVLL